jgi:hypothetical protein
VGITQLRWCREKNCKPHVSLVVCKLRPEHARVSSKGSLLGTINLWTPRVYCVSTWLHKEVLYRM